MRAVLGLAVLGMAGALALAGPAQARESYCSPTGDYCTSVARRDGAVLLRIATFSFRGRIRICVTDPADRRVCRSFPLRPRASLYEAKVRWHRNYPNAGPGAYRVRFFRAGTSLGPVLTFRLRS